MHFGWINLINLSAAACLVIINIVASRKGVSDSFSSRYPLVNILEQAGRYGCMALMVLPIFTKDLKFGFSSAPEMCIWICATALLLVIYGVLWVKKPKGGAGIPYALAIVPVVLFLLNGILLRHPALIVVSLLFGVCHLMIVKENV